MATKNHNLTTPSHGEHYNTWHVPLNENFSTIDRKLWVIDEISELSGYEPYENVAFLASDTLDLYFGDGGAWNKQGTLFEVTQDDIDRLESDIAAKADDPHDNAAHSVDFAVDGDAQPPTAHDNAAHSVTFAIDGDAQPAEDHAIAGARHTGDSFSALNDLIIDEDLSIVGHDHAGEALVPDETTANPTAYDYTGDQAPINIGVTGNSRAINIQSQTDTQASGSFGNIYWISAAGERYATVVGNSNEGDRDLAVYTKGDAFGSGDTSLMNRFQIKAGSDQTFADFYNLDILTLNGIQPDLEFSPTKGDTDVDTRIWWNDHLGDRQFTLRRRAADGTLRFTSLQGAGDILTFDTDGSMDANGQSLGGVGELGMAYDSYAAIKNVNNIYAELSSNLDIGVSDTTAVINFTEFGGNTSLMTIGGDGNTSVDNGAFSVPNGTIEEQGNRVATRSYMETDGSSKFWEGYELVFDNETPETNQYIRFETS